MRRLLLNLHLYGGLLCSSYLVLYGLSSLHFNHDFGAGGTEDPTATWTRTIELPDAENDQQLARQVAEELGLPGWVPPWNISRTRGGALRFAVTRPGKEYSLEVTPASGEVRIEERRRSLWHAMAGLHGLSEPIPGRQTVTAVWTAFTELTSWVLFFSAVSGIYLWVSRRRRGAGGWAVLVGVAALSIGLMVYVLLFG